MGKLLIVESPKKAKVISKILGTGWDVLATVGHFRDLPQHELGVNLETMHPSYVINNQESFERLKDAARYAESVWLATDPDREGEAIAWHVVQALRIKGSRRVAFHEITPRGVQAAVEAPTKLNLPLVRAQQARRVIDRFVGYMVSPRLPQNQDSARSGFLSTGRVQSPALRLLVEREREVRAFVSEKYYEVKAQCDGWTAAWDFEALLDDDKADPHWKVRQVADQVARTTALKVLSYNKRTEERAPAPPFTTSTLIQAASSQLKFSPDHTMKIAQALYELGVISYHRTDSFTLSQDALDDIRSFLKSKNLPISPTPRTWANKAGSQEAHEAVRPTSMKEESIPGASADEQALYNLIRMRTLACQMASAVVSVCQGHLESTTVTLRGAPAQFVARGETILSPGWKVLTKRAAENEDEEVANNAVPALQPGSVHSCECFVEEKNTKPPKRYTEAALVKKLEDEQIGRPSTYANIVSNLVNKGYVVLNQRLLIPQEIGFSVIDVLVKNRFSFVDLDFTRAMEAKLDDIAHSPADPDAVDAYFRVVRESHDMLQHELSALPAGKPKTPLVKLDGDGGPCPMCASGLMVTRMVTKDGPNKGKRFLSCNQYPKCKHVDWQDQENTEVPKLPGDGGECPRCHEGSLTTKRANKGRAAGKPFLSCNRYPTCDYMRWPDSTSPAAGPPIAALAGHGKNCPQCAEGVMKTKAAMADGPNKGKRFLGCSRFPDCKHGEYPPEIWGAKGRPSGHQVGRDDYRTDSDD